MKTINSVEVLANLVESIHMSSFESKSIILIGGVSRSGKSTLAKKLGLMLETKSIDCQIIEMDKWLVSLEKRKQNSKVIDRYHIESLIISLRDLLSDKVIFPPHYDSISRTQIAEIGSKPLSFKSGILIIEGVVALAVKELEKLAKIKIHVEISDFQRYRRLINFYKVIKAIPSKEYRQLIKDREKEEIPYIKKTSQKADVIFANN